MKQLVCSRCSASRIRPEAQKALCGITRVSGASNYPSGMSWFFPVTFWVLQWIPHTLPCIMWDCLNISITATSERWISLMRFYGEKVVENANSVLISDALLRGFSLPNNERNLCCSNSIQRTYKRANTELPKKNTLIVPSAWFSFLSRCKRDYKWIKNR